MGFNIFGNFCGRAGCHHTAAIVAAAASPKPARALAEAHRAHVSATEAENRRANLDPSDASARARAAYERAVSATPTDAALWRRYTAHVDATCRVRVTRAATHERATRNCPGDGETWASAIRFFFAESDAGSAGPGNEDAARRTFDRERGGRARLGFRTNKPQTVGVVFRMGFGG